MKSYRHFINAPTIDHSGETKRRIRCLLSLDEQHVPAAGRNRNVIERCIRLYRSDVIAKQYEKRECCVYGLRVVLLPSFSFFFTMYDERQKRQERANCSFASNTCLPAMCNTERESPMCWFFLYATLEPYRSGPLQFASIATDGKRAATCMPLVPDSR